METTLGRSLKTPQIKPRRQRELGVSELAGRLHILMVPGQEGPGRKSVVEVCLCRGGPKGLQRVYGKSWGLPGS